MARSETIRPYGKDRIAVHLPAYHPLLSRLKRQALSVATYTDPNGKLVAYDLCFEASEAGRLRQLLAESEAK